MQQLPLLLNSVVDVYARLAHDIALFRRIVLQKSKVAGSRIFGENTKREAIADSHRRNRIVEVACEFNVRRRGPSHTYTKVAPTAFRIFDHQCKTTFATQSLRSLPICCVTATDETGQFRTHALQQSRGGFESAGQDRSWSSNALASFRSSVSNPSVNQP